MNIRLLLVGLMTALLSRGLVAQFPAELRGRVLDAHTRVPVAGARVEVAGINPILTTDADGRFVLRGLAAGRWTVGIAGIGYRTERVVVELEDGRVTAVEIALQLAPVRLAELLARAADEGGASGAATVLDREVIERANARDLGDLLAAQGGLTVTRRGGPGAPATLSIRGSTANQVLVLVDGVPLNDPVTGDADLSTVRPELVERIVILRGAQAARYGAQALAGTILVETRRPAGSTLTLAAGSGAWGERNAYVAGGWRGGADPRRSVLLSAGYARTNGDFRFAVPDVRGGGEADRLNGDSEQWEALAAADLELRRWLVRGRLETHDIERGMPGSIVQPSLAARQQRDRSSGSMQVAWAGDHTEHRFDVGVQRQRNRSVDPSPPLGPAYDDSLWARTLSGALSSSVRHRAFVLSGGGEFRRLDLRSPSLVGGPSQRDFWGIWTQARLNARSGLGRWELAAGARADRDDLARSTYLSPAVSATLSRGCAALHLSWGRAFSPASLADQFFQEGFLVRANPDLLAERVRGEIEAGVTLDDVALLGASFDAGVTAFRADVNGMILWFPDHRFVWSPDNYDVQRTGFEVTGALRLPGRIAELRGAVSHVAATYLGPVLQGQVVYRPRFTANALLRTSLAALDLTAQYRYIGQRRTVPASALNTLPPFGVLDLQANWPIPAGRWRMELTAAIDNFLDHDAAMLVDYPVPGRTWRLGVQLTFGD